MQNLFFQPGISSGITSLNPEESRHCIKVLRKKTGDTIYITDGNGSVFEASITQADSTQCFFQVQRILLNKPRGYSFRLAIAPTKHTDRMEWMVEKCVELGIDRISFIQTAHTERTVIKTDRLKKIVTSAMKQSLQPYLPVLDPICSFSDFLLCVQGGEKFIAYGSDEAHPHLMDAASAGSACTVAIGPEGDFTPDELALAKENAFIAVSLGAYRLRTETAGLAACHIISLINRNF